MMNMLKKLLVLMLIIGVVLFGFGCCKNISKGTTSEHPSEKTAPQERPSSEHPSGEHGEHPSEEHPE